MSGSQNEWKRVLEKKKAVGKAVGDLHQGKE